ncbi:RsiV family protein [Mycobacterium sp. WMMD1722]|uniref:RsiV family protein n=1 Tax=Mycobacterium sp. WMMD1722 TaxID=3404117 RepID=UPI003BF53BC7
MLKRITAVASAVCAASILCPSAAGAQPVTPDPPVPQGVSNGTLYTVTQRTSDGATADGTGTWWLTVNTIAGGDGAVADAFNRASEASAQGQLDEARAGATTDGTWSFDTNPRIQFGAASVAQLISGLFNAVPSAHPVNYVSTVVIDSRTAAPITLRALFIDEQAGLNRLAEQTKILLPAESGQPPGTFDDDPGAAPVEANFANWIPTPAGLEIHFDDYQFFHGTPVITVPWPALEDVLSPQMRALRLP